MKPTLPYLPIALLGAALSAQSVTSPIGMALTEGPSSQTVLFGATDRRFQQIDATLAGSGARVFNSIAFRRDGNRTSTSSGARTMNMSVRLGHGDRNALGATFASNYLTPPTTVVATQQVSMPDWNPSVAGPAPFDFTVAFGSSFAFNGIDPLVWDITVDGASQPGTVFTDRIVDLTPFGFNEGTVRNTGCTVVGEVVPFRCAVVAFNYGPGHPQLGQRLVLTASGAPHDTPVVVDICLNTPSLPVPGLCAHFLPDLVVNLAMGVSSATGYTTDLTIDVPYNPLLEGVTLASQALSLDAAQPGLPFVFSDTRVFSLPPSAEGLDCHYVYAGPTDTVGTLFTNRGVVVRLQ